MLLFEREKRSTTRRLCYVSTRAFPRRGQGSSDRRAGGGFQALRYGHRRAVCGRRASPRARNTGWSPHIHHREDEASYVLEGEIMAQVGDQLIQAPAATLVFKPKGI